MGFKQLRVRGIEADQSKSAFTCENDVYAN